MQNTPMQKTPMQKTTPKHRLQHPAHSSRRQVLRSFGIVVACLGGTFSAIGFGSFFFSFGSFEQPRYFWCAFVGLPLLGLGMMMLRAGYLGAVTRYAASEIAPVAADTMNYMAGQTRESMQQIASAIGSGLRGDRTLACTSCHHGNDANAQFCSQCGTSLQPAACPKCQAASSPGARFCSDCGADLSSQQ
jgi:hypothetical protein